MSHYIHESDPYTVYQAPQGQTTQNIGYRIYDDYFEYPNTNSGQISSQNTVYRTPQRQARSQRRPSHHLTSMASKIEPISLLKILRKTYEGFEIGVTLGASCSFWSFIALNFINKIESDYSLGFGFTQEEYKQNMENHIPILSSDWTSPVLIFTGAVIGAALGSVIGGLYTCASGRLSNVKQIKKE